MPGLRRDNNKHGGNKQRVLLDGARSEPGPAARPRAYQQPTLSPAPFVARSNPEAKATADLPLWPGWHDDPTGRHESRYFDGLSWTANVQDGARASKDPFESEDGLEAGTGAGFEAGNGNGNGNGASTGNQFNGAGLVAFQMPGQSAAAPTGETNGNGNGNVVNGNGNGNGNGTASANGNGHHEEPEAVDVAVLLTGTIPLEG